MIERFVAMGIVFDNSIGIDVFSSKSIEEEIAEKWAEIMRPKTAKDWKQFYYLRRERKKRKYY